MQYCPSEAENESADHLPPPDHKILSNLKICAGYGKSELVHSHKLFSLCEAGLHWEFVWGKVLLA